MEKILFINIILIFSFTHLSYEYLVLPFKCLIDKKSKVYNIDNISGKDFLEFSTNKLISSISVGTPYKSLELYLTMDYKLFFIGNGYCNKNTKSLYEPLYSNSFINNSFEPTPFDDLRDITIGNDKITLYNDYNLKTNQSLNNVLLYYGNIAKLPNDNIKNKICGIMGFKLHSTENYYYNKFKLLENILKSNNITNYTFWTIEFFNENEKKRNNNYDGYLILGAGDNKYLKDIKNISQDDISYAYSSHLSSSIEWMINFQSIYYYYPKDNLTKMKKDLTKVEFNIDIDYYFSTKEYFELIKNSFFEKYLSKGICKINELKEFYLRYQFITCDKTSFNDELINFPTLYFLCTYYNYTFQLTYEDIFIEMNNKILFLVFYNPWSPNKFLFGKKFMTKYHFIFRYDQKNIGFLNYNITNDEKNEKEKKKDFFENQQLFQVLLIAILSIIFIGIIIFGICYEIKKNDKKRRKRTNELVDEDYVYDYKNEPINE